MVVYKIFYRRKKLLQLAWRKARCVGQAAVWTALKPQNPSEGLLPSTHSGCFRKESSSPNPESALADGLNRTLQHLAGIWLTLHTPWEETRQNSRKEISWSIFFFKITCSQLATEDTLTLHTKENHVWSDLWFLVCMYVLSFQGFVTSLTSKQVGDVERH